MRNPKSERIDEETWYFMCRTLSDGFMSEDTQGSDNASGYGNVALRCSWLLFLEPRSLLYTPEESSEIRVESQW